MGVVENALHKGELGPLGRNVVDEVFPGGKLIDQQRVAGHVGIGAQRPEVIGGDQGIGIEGGVSDVDLHQGSDVVAGQRTAVIDVPHMHIDRGRNGRGSDALHKTPGLGFVELVFSEVGIELRRNVDQVSLVHVVGVIGIDPDSGVLVAERRVGSRRLHPEAKEGGRGHDHAVDLDVGVLGHGPLVDIEDPYQLIGSGVRGARRQQDGQQYREFVDAHGCISSSVLSWR